MTMKPKDNDDIKVVVTIVEEYYLRGREEPISIPVTYEYPRSQIDEGDEVSDIANMALQTLLQNIDIVREHRIIRSDERYNKFVFLTDQVQAVSILPPDKETILKAIEEAS